MSFLKKLFGGSDTKSEQKSQYGMPGSDAVAEMYKKALGTVGPEPEGAFPAYAAPPAWEKLQAGDYDALEKAIYEGGAGRLSEDRDFATKRFLASMRKIGMADDPSAQQLMGETITTPYTRGLTDLASNATAQRYGLQSQDLNAYNTGMTDRSNALNTYNQNTYTLPRDYYLKKMGLFYTPSTVSTGSGSALSTSSTQTGIIPGISGLMSGSGTFLTALKPK